MDNIGGWDWGQSFENFSVLVTQSFWLNFHASCPHSSPDCCEEIGLRTAGSAQESCYLSTDLALQSTLIRLGLKTASMSSRAELFSSRLHWPESLLPKYFLPKSYVACTLSLIRVQHLNWYHQPSAERRSNEAALRSRKIPIVNGTIVSSLIPLPAVSGCRFPQDSGYLAGDFFLSTCCGSRPWLTQLG